MKVSMKAISSSIQVTAFSLSEVFLTLKSRSLTHNAFSPCQNRQFLTFSPAFIPVPFPTIFYFSCSTSKRVKTCKISRHFPKHTCIDSPGIFKRHNSIENHRVRLHAIHRPIHAEIPQSFKLKRISRFRRNQTGLHVRVRKYGERLPVKIF